jgi:hypothetical protein
MSEPSSSSSVAPAQHSQAWRFGALITTVLICAASAALAEPQTGTHITSVAGIRVCKQAGPPITILFRSGMAIDVDGAPKAYHAQDALALNRLAGAGQPGHWWALVTKDGKPVIQGPGDPAPGYYVSMTSLQNPAFEVTDPRRYVDASTIPYVALPKAVVVAGKVGLGDLVAVVNEANGKVAYAIYADQGPKNKLGEGSIYLVNQLRTSPLLDSSAMRRSLAGGIVYVLFPGSGNRRPKSREEIVGAGAKLFAQRGGLAALKACFP